MRGLTFHQVWQHFVVNIPAKVAGNELRDDAVCVLIIAGARVADFTKQATIRAVLCYGTYFYLEISDLEGAACTFYLERLSFCYDPKIADGSLTSGQANIP